MAQPSVASFFNNRKRAAIEDTKINQARKVLVLDSSHIKGPSKEGLEKEKSIILTQVPQDSLNSQDECTSDKLKKLQEKEKKIAANKIVMAVVASAKSNSKNFVRANRTKKMRAVSNNKDIQELFNKMTKPPETTSTKPIEVPDESTKLNDHTVVHESHVTPPNTPTKRINAMDKIRLEGPSLKEIKNKMTRSARLLELKASLGRFQDGDKKLKEIETKTAQIAESPKIKGFRTIELEVQTSPQKIFSPEKAYLSPRKESSGVRKNLLNLLSSPTKNAVAVPFQSPSKDLLEQTSKPALTLPFKYRFLAEMFRAIDTVVQILYNRKETITFRKLKPAVEEMLKRNLMEKHLAQINTVYPEAFHVTQEKLKIYGAGSKAEQWELVVKPKIKESENMTSEIVLERRRKLFSILLEKVKCYHHEFLMSLDPPISIKKDEVTRWHAEFDIEKVPDIDLTPLPQPPAEDKLTTGKEVLERARVLFNVNTRMELALQKLKEAKQTQTPLPVNDQSREMPHSVLKGIPKALLEKVRQKQAAKALLTMTRSVDKEKELQQYSRLPELARLTRNLFVSEKKGVLPLDTVVDKLGNCYRGNLTKAEMEEHLKIISQEVPSWLIFHNIRSCIYIKLNKNADLSLVINKLEEICKLKSET